MESLQIRTGQKQLLILDDNGNERGVFTFNPEDIECAKRMLAIKNELTDKQIEYNERVDAAKTEDERIELLDEIVSYFKNLVDNCFGEGTSKLLFGDAKSLSMFYDFFAGVMPYFENASVERKSKYTKRVSKK